MLTENPARVAEKSNAFFSLIRNFFLFNLIKYVENIFITVKRQSTLFHVLPPEAPLSKIITLLTTAISYTDDFTVNAQIESVVCFFSYLHKFFQLFNFYYTPLIKFFFNFYDMNEFF